MKIYSLNPALNLRNAIPEEIYNNSERFVQFLKAYYEWMHTTEFTVESISGTLVKGEAVQGQISKSTATISYVKSANASYVVFITGNRPFEISETLVGQTSGAQVRLLSIKDNVLRQSNQLLNYRDINQTIDKFEKYLKDELFSAVPANFEGNTRELAKRFRDFYLSKGQEQSYRYFMKTLYDQDIDLKYPGDDILKVSAGNYVRDTVIRANIIGDPGSSEIFNFLFKTIKGRTSGAIANVVDITKKFVGTSYIAEFKLTFVSGTFVANEIIYDISDTSLTPLETTINGIISGFTIVNPGTGYYPGDLLTITGNGQAAYAQVSDISTAKIDKIKVNTYGHGYRLGAQVNVDNTDTGGSGLIAVVSGITNTYPVTIGANTYTLGEVTKVSIANTGSGYYKAPVLSLEDSVVVNAGLLTDKYITIVNGGNTYSVNDNFLFSAAFGSSAAAHVGSVDLGVQSRTNYVRNSTMVGANTITGALPTGWGNVNGGLTISTVGTGIEDGLSYIDIQFSGTTNTTSAGVRFTTYTDTPALPGEIWASSFYVKLVGGSLANVQSGTLSCNFQGLNSVGGIAESLGSTFVPSSTTLERRNAVFALSAATTVYIRPQVSLSFLSGVNINFTIRVAAPQLEKNYFVTDYIPTTDAAVTIAGYGEPTRVNVIRNSIASGAVVGTPGTAPTNWSVSPGSNLSSQIVSTGVEDGINYIDVRFFGTNNTNATQYPSIGFESITQTPAVANSVWTNSAYVRRVGGTTANVSGIIMVIGGYTSTSVSTNQYATNTISSLEATSIISGRKIVTSSNTAFSNTQTAFIRPWFQFQVANTAGANTIDITVRVGAPQFEFGNTATSYIQTTGASRRRPSNEPTNDYSVYLEDGDRVLDENNEFVKYNTTDTAISEWVGVGKISRVQMTNFGSGYLSNNLPIITVPTSNIGFGANLITTNIQGRGTSLVVDTANNTQKIGGIRKVEIVDFGVGYTTANVDTIGVGGQNANIIPIIRGSGVTEGRFIDDAGKIDYKKIQDSYYYQEYSYVIRSGIEISKYREVLKKLIHPAGLEVFGEILIQNELNLQSDIIENLVLGVISKSTDTLTPSKIEDFILSGLYSIYSDVPLSVLESNTILPYRYFTFLSQYGSSIYIQTERNIKLPGTASAFSSNGVVLGVGTTFASEFSSGDEVVLVDRSSGKNLLQYSTDLSNNSIWTKFYLSTSNTVFAPNAIEGPFGGWTAHKIVEDTAFNNHALLYPSIPIVAGQFYTVSFYAKDVPGSRSTLTLYFWPVDQAQANGFYENITWGTTKTISPRAGFGSGTTTAGSIVDVGNGWYRISLSGRFDTVSTQARFRLFLGSSGNIGYTGDGKSGIYIDGIQFELGNTATTYIGPTYNANNKFSVASVANNTYMTVRVPPANNMFNSEVYVLSL